MKDSGSVGHVDPNALGENFRKERIKREWHQYELAEKLGLSPNSISYYESGRSMPSLALAIQMANLFEISLDKLAGRDQYNTYETVSMESVANSITNLLKIKGATGCRVSDGGFAVYFEPNQELTRYLHAYLDIIECSVEYKECTQKNKKTILKNERDNQIGYADALAHVLSFTPIQTMQMNEDEMLKRYKKKSKLILVQEDLDEPMDEEPTE